MAGKLKGAIMAKTPIGSLMTSPSMPQEAPTILSPCCRTGIPHATSTFSVTRFISARASTTDLPISSAIIREIFSPFSTRRSRSLKSGAVRRSAGVAAHPGKAALAAATAASVSFLPLSGARAMISVVLGFSTSIHWQPSGIENSPLM